MSKGLLRRTKYKADDTCIKLLKSKTLSKRHSRRINVNNMCVIMTYKRDNII